MDESNAQYKRFFKKKKNYGVVKFHLFRLHVANLQKAQHVYHMV